MTFKRLLSVMLVVCIVTSMLTISTSAESETITVSEEIVEIEGDTTGGSTTGNAPNLSLALEKDQVREGDTHWYHSNKL